LTKLRIDIGPVSDTSWITGRGEMKVAGSNEMILSIESESGRPYDIRVLGTSTNNSVDVPEDLTVETIHVREGKQAVQLKRFVIYTYDFKKQ
jgi:hypothetical protein